jgi:CheY-like chemotaxis protein
LVTTSSPGSAASCSTLRFATSDAPDGRGYGGVSRLARCLLWPMLMTSSEQAASVPTRILLAEDDSELRALIAETLRRSGYEVVEAENGDQLLELLAETAGSAETPASFDLVVSDVRMPAFTAMDVLIGARRLLGRTPFVLMTAFGDRGLHEQALRYGARAVLDKPVRLSELRAVVEAALAHSSSS